MDVLPRFSDKDEIRILGPFWHGYHRKELGATREKDGKWDYFITAENREIPIDLAEKCIGFRLPKSENEIRFPYWQWYLTWPEYETKPDYNRFGGRLSIDALLQPIQANFPKTIETEFNKSKCKSVLLTSHFKRHRRQLYRLADKAMGCDAFGRKIRPTNLAKKELLSPYFFNLCPENRIAEGYITEKAPEAFLCGCVPITYCAPEDLERDFNPNAVINLFGLTKRGAHAKLHEAATNFTSYTSYLEEPLLSQAPSIEPLLEFLRK